MVLGADASHGKQAGVALGRMAEAIRIKQIVSVFMGVFPSGDTGTF